MSLQQAVGDTYSGTQVTIGSTTNNGANVAYQALEVDDSASLSINSVSGSTVGFSYKGVTGTINGYATVIANDANSFVLSYINGTTVINFYISNSPQNNNPQLDSASVPDEYVGVTYQAPCYCPGTLIRTVSGDVAVEDLAAGDEVVTTSGEVKAIRWIGTRSYAARFAAANPAIRPVRFLVGSLGMDSVGRPVPSRDLLVSPRHAMLIDGVLVPAELLVNGSTILRDHTRGDVRYVHVELPEHDAIWAENAPSETFLDDGSRILFHNAATFAASHPDHRPAAEPAFCAPRVEDGPALEAIRRRLNAPTALAA